MLVIYVLICTYNVHCDIIPCVVQTAMCKQSTNILATFRFIFILFWFPFTITAGAFKSCTMYTIYKAVNE